MRFIVRNMISPVLAHRMEVLFEELCVQIVLFGLKPAGGVDFSFSIRRKKTLLRWISPGKETGRIP